MQRRSETRIALIGAGPGDPDLLTLKAARLIAAADVLLHDSLVDSRVLAMADGSARRIDVGKRCGAHSATQAEICRLLVAEARKGGLIVRLKGGDPMIFGRATEEIAALAAAGFSAEIVPGITAASAAAASVGRSLTQRGAARALHILAGHTAEGCLPAHDWAALIRAGGTLAIYMGRRTLRGLAMHMIEAGISPAIPAIAVENASLPNEQVITGPLTALPGLLQQNAGDGPIIVLIGEALNAADQETISDLSINACAMIELTR